MSDREPTQEEQEAAEKLVDETIKRFQQERDAKPNALKQSVKWEDHR